MNKKNVEMFGNYIGTYIGTDRGLSKNRPRSFLRVRVDVDVYNPLKLGIFIKNDDGTNHWLAFKYERLSDFYFGCGRLGHMVNDCSNLSTAETSPLDPLRAFGS